MPAEALPKAAGVTYSRGTMLGFLLTTNRQGFGMASRLQGKRCRDDALAPSVAVVMFPRRDREPPGRFGGQR